ncbi:MFS transporter, PPP family, 3-phenylpropionic acid transporter [Gammaproteobacteria bacterium]
MEVSPSLPVTIAPAPHGIYLRLSTFYLFYFGALGALVPYWSVYLQAQGLRPKEIGELIALFSITRIIAPNVWGYVADRSGMRMPIVRLATGLAAANFLVVLWVHSFWGLAVVMSLFTFFWHAALPQMETIVIDHLGAGRYGRVRLWGSVGFITVVLLVGPLLDRFGIQTLPWVLLVLYTGLWLSSLMVPEAPVANRSLSSPSFSWVMGRPEVVTFLVVCFLMQASHGPYYTFYSIYLETHGNNRTLISELWALGVIAEVGAFLVVGRWLLHYGTNRLLHLTLGLATLRWLLIGTGVDYLPILILAQLLHAATFGVYHATAIHIVHNLFTGSHQVRGQALYSSLGFGAGGALGSLYAGYFWDWLGPAGTFGMAAAISASALVILYQGQNLAVSNERLY